MLQEHEDFIHVVSAELVEALRGENRGPQTHGEFWEMLSGRQDGRAVGRDWGGLEASDKALCSQREEAPSGF